MLAATVDTTIATCINDAIMCARDDDDGLHFASATCNNSRPTMSTDPDATLETARPAVELATVCRRCLGTEHETTCNHPTGDKPDWKRETSEKMRAIYGHRATLFTREVTGKVTDAENSAFDARE